MTFLEELQWRGLVKDVTDMEGLSERLNRPLTCYCGFDPTADSLHIGHLQQIMLLRRYQMAGHRPIALCGGATGMIGDPRPTTERKLLTMEDLQHNVEGIKKQLARFLDFEDGKALLLNNFDWLGNLNLLQFLRDYGKHFNVSYMIAKDTIQKRLSSGISFTEFTYTILQAIDFKTLYENYDCELQIGGSDQWGNLVSGCDLIRKMCGENAKVYGVTSPLITKSDGSKFGKSEGGNIWLDPNKTSAYEFYQFWVNVADSDVISLLKRLSFRTPDQIMEVEKSLQEEPHLRKAQKALAEELTELVHGKAGLESALRITATFFGGDIRELSFEELKQGIANMPHVAIENQKTLTEVLVSAKIASSKREARELITHGSIQLNGEKVTDTEFLVDRENAFEKTLCIIKKGKKNWFVCTFE